MIKAIPESPEAIAKREAFEKEAGDMESWIADVKADKIPENEPDSRAQGEPAADEAAPETIAQPDPKSVTQEAQKTEQVEQPKPEAKLSKYDKAAQRASSEWQRINAEKAEIAKHKAEVDAWKREKEEAKLAEERRIEQEEAGKPTPEQYEALAKQLENSGDDTQAALARQMAGERRQEIAKRQAKQTQPGKFWNDTDFSKKQAEAFETAAKEYPDIRSSASPLSNKIRAIMQEPAVSELVQSSPNGIYFVAKYAATESSAARVPELEGQVKTLTQKLRELELRSTPVGGDHVLDQVKQKAWNEMTSTEQERELDKAYG